MAVAGAAAAAVTGAAPATLEAALTVVVSDGTFCAIKLFEMPCGDETPPPGEGRLRVSRLSQGNGTEWVRLAPSGLAKSSRTNRTWRFDNGTCVLVDHQQVALSLRLCDCVCVCGVELPGSS